MAKVQQRRAVSLNRDVYVAASAFAFKQGITLSHLATDAMREHMAKFGVTLVVTEHVPVEIAERAATGVRHSILRREQRRHTKKRYYIGSVATSRLVDTYVRVREDGPIRKALGDAYANRIGEPHWHRKIPFGVRRPGAAVEVAQPEAVAS